MYAPYYEILPLPPVAGSAPPAIPNPWGGVERRRMGPYNYIYMIIYVYTDL